MSKLKDKKLVQDYFRAHKIAYSTMQEKNYPANALERKSEYVNQEVAAMREKEE